MKVPKKKLIFKRTFNFQSGLQNQITPHFIIETCTKCTENTTLMQAPNKHIPSYCEVNLHYFKYKLKLILPVNTHQTLSNRYSAVLRICTTPERLISESAKLTDPLSDILKHPEKMATGSPSMTKRMQLRCVTT
jgi:hypothetical protein